MSAVEEALGADQRSSLDRSDKRSSPDECPIIWDRGESSTPTEGRSAKSADAVASPEASIIVLDSDADSLLDELE
ncbi:MAG: hypothetical protein GY832_43060 [Chloroflexi bacterium]|nr:hypothetical protein [Chloroflexota bacterium]